MELRCLIILPPAVADVTDNSKGSKSEVQNTGVHAFGGLLTQLLGGFGANGALRSSFPAVQQQETNYTSNDQYPLYHTP